MKAMIVVLTVVSGTCATAVGAEIETECPLTSPYNGEMIRGAFSSVDTPEDPEGNILKRSGLHWHHINLLEKWDEYEATLECQYPGQDLVLRIPGKILRCEWQAHDVPKPKPVRPNTGGPYDTVFERIWCTSRE